MVRSTAIDHGYQTSCSSNADTSESFGSLVVPHVALDANEVTPLCSDCRTLRTNRDPSECEDSSLVISRELSKTPERIWPPYILMPFLIYCVAMGAVAIPKLNVILALMCLQYDTESNITTQRLGSELLCRTPAIYSRMGRFMVCANIISGIGCAIASPRMGALSDRYGRKPLLAISALGLLFGDIVSVVAGCFPDRISVYWILLEFGIGGLTGSFVTTMSLLQAYVADCTEGERRTRIFSQLHACNYLGIALGPAVGALLIRAMGEGDILSVFYVAAPCHAAFIAFILLGIPETGPTRLSRSYEEPSSSPDTKMCGITSRVRTWLNACNIFHPLAIFRTSSEASRGAIRGDILLPASIDSITFGTQLGLVPILILYSEYHFGWRIVQASLFVSVTNATRAIALVFLLPVIVYLADRRIPKVAATPGLNSSDKSMKAFRLNIVIIRVALVLSLISHLGFALSTYPLPFTASGIIAAASAAVSPTTQSLMSNYVDSERLGELLGAIGLLHALARVSIPALLQLVYSVTVERVPEAVFWILAMITGAVLWMSLRISL